MIPTTLHRYLDNYSAPGQYAHRTRFIGRLDMALLDRVDPKRRGSTTVGMLDVEGGRAFVDGKALYDELADTLADHGYEVERRGGGQ